MERSEEIASFVKFLINYPGGSGYAALIKNSVFTISRVTEVAPRHGDQSTALQLPVFPGFTVSLLADFSEPIRGRIGS